MAAPRQAGTWPCHPFPGPTRELPRSTENLERETGISYSDIMIEPEELVGEEWAEWYRLSPAERWLESEKLWETFLALGGSLDPEPDTQSPFFDPKAPRPRSAHGRAGVRVIRRGGV